MNAMDYQDYKEWCYTQGVTDNSVIQFGWRAIEMSRKPNVPRQFVQVRAEPCRFMRNNELEHKKDMNYASN